MSVSTVYRYSQFSKSIEHINMRHKRSFRQAQRGVTLIELTAIILSVTAVAFILLLAIQRNRERARRAQCAYNLKLVARACQQYEVTHGSLPLGTNAQAYFDPSGERFLGYHTGWSLHAVLVPYLGRMDLFNSMNLSLGPYQLRNSTVVGTMLHGLWCPADPEIIGLSYLIEERTHWDGTTFSVAYTSYGGVMGSFAFGRGVNDHRRQLIEQNGMFPNAGLPSELGGPGTQPAVKYIDVPDGLGNTLLLGERAHGKLSKWNCGPGGQCSFRGNGWWASSDYGDATITAFYPPNFTSIDVYGTHALGDPGSPTERCDSATPFAMSASSYHKGGTNFGFADGSVRFVKDSIDSWDYRDVARKLDGDCVPPSHSKSRIYQKIATRNGGEQTELKGF